MTTVDEIRRLLRDQFSHDHFRPGQESVIRSLLAGRDVLAVLPTGAGKLRAIAGTPAPFSNNERVVHPTWGEGLVQRVAGGAITVLFDELGYKTLDPTVTRMPLSTSESASERAMATIAPLVDE